MITLRAFINEAKQVGTLYHFTKPENLHKLLDDDLQKSRGNGSLHLISHNNSISTTRNYNLSQDVLHRKLKGNLGVDKGYSVRIALDGDKISEHHKIRPVLGLKDNEHDVHNLKDTNRVSRHEQENEESVNSSRLPIKQYIKRIDFVHHDNLSNGAYEKLSDKLKSHNISHDIDKKWHNSHPELKENVAKDIDEYSKYLDECFVVEL